MNKIYTSVGLFGLAILLSCWLAKANAQEVPFVWKNVKIGGGGFVPGLVFNDSVPNVFYARTDVGGAYRFEKDTKTWTPLTDFLGRDREHNYGVLSLATDPTSPNRVYMATGTYTRSWGADGAILKSEDFGSTWKIIDVPTKFGGNEEGRSTGERLQIDPLSPNILYLGTSVAGLWRSVDFGESWSQVSSFPIQVMPENEGGLSFVLLDSSPERDTDKTNRILVGALVKGKPNLFASENGGTTWEEVPGYPLDMMPHQIAKLDQESYLITYADGPGPNGITAGKLFRLDWDEKKWTALPVPSGQGGFGGLSVSNTVPKTIMVSTFNRLWPGDEIYLSKDGGSSWLPALAGADRNHDLAPYAKTSNPHWIGDLEIDPFDHNHAWFVTGYGVYQTTNLQDRFSGGQVLWTFQIEGLEETVPLELISPRYGPPLLSALGDIDGFRHDELFVSPPAGRFKPESGTSRSIDFAHEVPYIVARTADSGTNRFGGYTTDGGVNWTNFPQGPAGITAGGSIAISADGGVMVWVPQGASPQYMIGFVSWQPVTGAKPGVKIISNKKLSDYFYQYDALSGSLLQSKDRGRSFQLSNSSLPRLESWELWRGTIKSAPQTDGDLWLTAKDGLYYSSNHGVAFTKIAGFEESSKVGFGRGKSMTGTPTVFVVGTYQGVQGFFFTEDYGTSWRRINDDLHQFGGINDIVGDGQFYGRVYLAAGARGIMVGQSTKDCRGVEGGDYTYSSCGECVAPGTGEEDCLILSIPESKNTEIIGKVYPNPFEGEALLKVGAEANYQIYDASGRLLEAGICADSRLIGQGLRTGLYILVLSHRSNSQIIKLIKK